MGFGTHPHDNMEIISIPLSGDLEHRDSMGNVTVIRQNDIQIMSAGTGIQHSEYNKNKDKKVNFLQIWVFPKQRDIKPRYDQITLKPDDRINKLQQIVSPSKDDEGVWINQDAWFSLGNFKKDISREYSIHQKGNGVYAFVIEGDVTINGQKLNKRDGLGVAEVDKISIAADNDAEILEGMLSKKNIQKNILIQDESRPTLRKIRILAQKQHVVRVDYEKVHPLHPGISKIFLENILSQMPYHQGVILQDYGKGIFNSDILSFVTTAKEKGIPVFVDPTFTELHTRSVTESASGMERIKSSSAAVIPLATRAEYPPMKLTPTSAAARSSARAMCTYPSVPVLSATSCSIHTPSEA